MFFILCQSSCLKICACARVPPLYTKLGDEVRKLQKKSIVIATRVRSREIAAKMMTGECSVLAAAMLFIASLQTAATQTGELHTLI